jgi:hypothetical protein
MHQRGREKDLLYLDESSLIADSECFAIVFIVTNTQFEVAKYSQFYVQLIFTNNVNTNTQKRSF